MSRRAGLEHDQPDRGIVEEGVEDADGVRPAAHTRHHGVGKTTRHLLDLNARLQADDPLEVAHHGRERVRPGRGAEAVVGAVGVGDPVPEGLVDGVLEGLRTGFDRDHLGAQQPHPCHVERLTPSVDGAHVDHAFQAEQRARGGGGDPVLTGTGLGDHSGLAHVSRQQSLPEHVVDLVRTGVVQVLSFQEDAGPAGMRGQTLGLIQR